MFTECEEELEGKDDEAAGAGKSDHPLQAYDYLKRLKHIGIPGPPIPLLQDPDKNGSQKESHWSLGRQIVEHA